MGHFPIYCSSITVDAEIPEHAKDYHDRYPNATTGGQAPFKGCIGTGTAMTEKMREDFEPLMLKYGVDLYLCGHEHDYESLWPTKNYQVTDKSFKNPKAPIHVI